MRFLLLVLALFVGCVGPTFVVQQYAGPPRPPASIAMLRVNGAEAVRLQTLDDEYVAAPLERDSRLHIELLPGRHSLTVQDANAPDERLSPIVFEAEAGKVYRVLLAAGAPPRLWEVDRGTDAALREAAGLTGDDRAAPTSRAPASRAPAAPVGPADAPGADAGAGADAAPTVGP